MNKLMENSKFALSAEPEFPLGMPMYRLRAKRDIGPDVKAGEMGGLVSGPASLAEDGDCWVYPGGMVYAGGRVSENALVHAGASVSLEASLRGNSQIRGINLVGQFDLCGTESLRSESALIINVLLARVGQFVVEAETVFVLEYNLGEGASSSLMLPASQCTSSFRAHLACRQAGDRVAFLRVGNGKAELLPRTQNGQVPFEQLDKNLRTLQAF